MNGRGKPKVMGYIKGLPGPTGLYNCHHDMYSTVRKTEEHTIGVSMKDTKGREGESKHVTSLTNGRDCHWPSLSGWTAVTHPTAGMVQSIRASR